MADMEVVAEEFIREGAICYLDVEADTSGVRLKIGRLYAEAPVSSPLLAVAARDIQRAEVVQYNPEKNTDDLMVRHEWVWDGKGPFMTDTKGEA